MGQLTGRLRSQETRRLSDSGGATEFLISDGLLSAVADAYPEMSSRSTDGAGKDRAHEGKSWAASAVTVGLAVSLLPILLRMLPRSPGTPQHSSATRTTVSPPSAWSCTRPPSPASSSCSTCGECPAYALPTRMISERAGGLAGRRGQSLTGEAERTIVFGDSHQQFRRPGPNGTQVVNRGSVGAPGRRPPRSVGVLLRRRDPLPPNGVRHRADRRPLLAPAR
jgi:hypothetical protein